MRCASSIRLALLAALCCAGLISGGWAQEIDDALVFPSYSGDSEYAQEFLEGRDAWRDYRWNAEFEAIFLRRETREPLALVDGATPYSASDLDFPFEFGARVTFIRNGIFDSRWDIEGTYFGVNHSFAQAASEGAETFFTNPNIVFPARRVKTEYRSDLFSTELNVRRRLGDELTLIGGFRWIEMRDELFTDLVDSSHRINVNNHLYGGQAGADLWLFRLGRLDVNAWAKLGLFGNVADQTTTLDVLGAAPSVSARGCQAAFAGELALAGMYRLTECLAVRAGYQLLWLDGMVTAPQQIPSTDLLAGVAVLDFSDTLFYHGGYIGMEANW